MKILILEDTLKKLNAIISEIKAFNKDVSITISVNQMEFSTWLERCHYDLIIIDLMVPLAENQEPTDLTETLILKIRDDDCINRNTEILVLTEYSVSAERCTEKLGVVGLQIIKFSDDAKWKSLLLHNLKKCNPAPIFDFLIICALKIESNAFSEFYSDDYPNETLEGFDCRRININDFNGLVVTCPRMGLVVASIITTQAIEYFKPKIVCMSGICAGLKSSGANIYDLVLSDTTYQHDAGKWINGQLVSEIYQVQLDSDVKTFLRSKIVDNPEIECSLMQDIHPRKDEIPNDYVKPKIKLETTSSGSTVVADSYILKSIEDSHRKVYSFEMETFALYEAARMSRLKPKYFSCKCVVDDGSEAKGDNYQLLASKLSARCTVEILRGLLKGY